MQVSETKLEEAKDIVEKYKSLYWHDQHVEDKEPDFDEIFLNLTLQNDLYDYEEMSLELLKLLSNPATSSQLSEFGKTNYGRMLYKLNHFFARLGSDNKFDLFIDKTSLQFRQDLEEGDVNRIIEKYSLLLKDKSTL